MSTPPFTSFAQSLLKARGLWIAAGLALLTVVVRLPFAHIIDDDEAFYSLVGQGWWQGVVPYAGSFDVKPPLLFGIFAIVQAVFGVSLATIKGIEIAFTVWSAIALQRLIARQGFLALSLWAGGLFPVLSLAQSGAAAANALILAPFVISAFSLLLTATGATEKPLRSICLAGLLIGLAGMVKQTAVFEATGLCIFVIWHFRHRHPVRTGLVFLAAAALPAVLFAVCFAVASQFSALWQSVVMGALVRGGMALSPGDANGIPLFFQGVKFILLLSPLLGLILPALMAGIYREAVARAFPGPLLPVTVVWSLAAAAGCISAHSDLRYYGIAMIPPLLIMSGAFILSIAPAQGWRRYGLMGGSAVIIVICAAGLGRDAFRQGAHLSGDDYAAARATSAELRRLHLAPSDKLLIPRRGLYTYIATGTLPARRYFHSMHLLCDFPTPDPSPLADILAQRPRFIVVSEPALPLTCENPLRQRQIDAVLDRDYRLAGVARGAWSHSLIYELRSANRHPDQHAQ